MLDNTLMHYYINSKVSALFGLTFGSGGVAALLDGQPIWSVCGIALGVLGCGFAIYRYPNDQALKEVVDLRKDVVDLRKQIKTLMIENEQISVHSAALEQQIEESGMKLIPTKADLEKKT